MIKHGNDIKFNFYNNFFSCSFKVEFEYYAPVLNVDLCVQTEVTKEIWVSRSDKYYVQNKSDTKHNNTRLLMAKSLSILYIYKVHVYLHLSISMLRNGPIIMNIFNTNNHVTG